MIEFLPLVLNRNPMEEAMQTNVPTIPAPTALTGAVSGFRTVAFSLLVDRALSA
jgi:hypothetical protein